MAQNDPKAMAAKVGGRDACQCGLSAKDVVI
jgi:hypothetical protein